MPQVQMTLFVPGASFINNAQNQIVVVELYGRENQARFELKEEKNRIKFVSKPIYEYSAN